MAEQPFYLTQKLHDSWFKQSPMTGNYTISPEKLRQCLKMMGDALREVGKNG